MEGSVRWWRGVRIEFSVGRSVEIVVWGMRAAKISRADCFGSRVCTVSFGGSWRRMEDSWCSKY